MSAERSAPRRRSREAALQALYAVDVGPRASLARAADSLSLVGEHFELHPGAAAFAQELVEGVAANAEGLDLQIEAAARNWRIGRMAVVDRNVLRIAAFELGFLGTPAEVAIDEAVELARRFGDDGSPRFVNGVLGALAEKDER